MSSGIFDRPDAMLMRSLAALLDVIEKTFPLPGRFRAGLPGDVAELSRLLTSERSNRDDGYLGKPNNLSAYLRYFLPWNVYRLLRLLPNIPLDLKDGDSITDLGSGPLTAPIALWLARPDLRKTRLEFRCLDRTGKVLEAGSQLIARLMDATGGSSWKIRTIRGTLGTRVEGAPAALVTAANVLNELFWDDRRPLREQADRKAVLLSALAAPDGAVLVVEPGIPRSGTFISALRAALADHGRLPIAPCPHTADCPLPGGKPGAKWCHFAFDTDDAPARLHSLSAAAGIPKERATLSFLLAGGAAADAERTSVAAQTAEAESMAARIISDPIALPGSVYGRYACTVMGLALVTAAESVIRHLASGTLVEIAKTTERFEKDQKSGAWLMPLTTRPDAFPGNAKGRSPR